MSDFYNFVDKYVQKFNEYIESKKEQKKYGDEHFYFYSKNADIVLTEFLKKPIDRILFDGFRVFLFSSDLILSYWASNGLRFLGQDVKIYTTAAKEKDEYILSTPEGHLYAKQIYAVSNVSPGYKVLNELKKYYEQAMENEKLKNKFDQALKFQDVLSMIAGENKDE